MRRGWKVVVRMVVLVILGFLFSSGAIKQYNNFSVSAQSQSGVSADTVADSKMVLPPNPGGSTLPFAGQNHSYSVVYRGNGEAVVTLRVTLTNTNEDNSLLNSVTLRIPKVEPRDLAVYQIFAQGYCIRYENRPYIQGQSYIQPKCLEYSEPDYFNYYGGGKYQRAKFDYKGDTLTVTLPKAIASQKTGSFFVYFRALGYAKKNLFGAYAFQFESLKTDSSINQLNVGIGTDADQVLKGAKGNVEYRFSEASLAMKALPSADAGAVANSSIDRYVQQIGQGTIVKSASNLAPLESYKVTGMFASNTGKLYGKEISMFITIILILIFIVVAIVRKVFKRGAGKDEGMMGKELKDSQKAKSVSLDSGGKNFLISLGISFGCSIVITLYTIGLFALFSYLSLGYIDYQLASLIRLLTGLFSFIFYLVALFAPPIYIGYKKGVGWGIGTLMMVVGWLFIYLVIGIAVVMVFGYTPSYGGGITPMLRNAVDVAR